VLTDLVWEMISEHVSLAVAALQRLPDVLP
jgi:hypothetical protein